MKKLIALLLALCLLLSLCACGKKEVEPVPDDGPGGLEDVSDEPIVEEEEEASPYPGTLPLGGETASGQVIEIPEEGTLEYLGSKVVENEYGDPVLLSFFDFVRGNDYENSVSWTFTTYAYQGEAELWTTSYTYNGVVLDDTLYEDVNPGDTLEVCMAYELENLTAPVTFTFTDTWEELEPVELVVDLSEVEICMEAVKGVSGLYMAQYLYADGYDYDYDALVEYGYADNSYVELYEDNTGILCVAGQAAELLYSDEYFYIGEQELYYEMEDGILTLEGDDLYYEFAWTDSNAPVPEEEDESFEGETVTTPAGYVSITLDKGWYVDGGDHGYTLVLYNEELGTSKWVKIMDNQLTSLEKEMEYTQLALADSVYEEVTIGGNTYQMLFDDEWSPLAYLVAGTSTGYAFTVEIRNIYPEDVMTMLESIQIH